MNLEKMKKIVDGAPELSEYYCSNEEMYHCCDDLAHYDCCINLQDLRAEIAKHDTLDLEPSDIPHSCVVVEK